MGFWPWKLVVDPLIVNEIEGWDRFVKLVVMPIIIITGISFNLFTVAMMMLTKLRNVSYGYYLTSLALSDTAYLMIWFCITINNFGIYSGTSLVVNVEGHFFCKLLEIVPVWAMTYSSWQMILIASERAVVVCAPLKAKDVCTSTTALRASIALIPISLFTSIFTIIYMIDKDGICVMPHDSYLARMILSALGIMYIPAFVVATLSIVIILALIKSRANFKSKSKDRAAAKVTGMLLTLTIVFVLLTSPGWTLECYITANPGSIDPDSLHTAHTATHVIYLLNHSINFLVYLGTNDEWRKEALQLIRLKS